MPENSLGAIEGPDLNFSAFDPDQQRRFDERATRLRIRQLRRADGRPPLSKAVEDRRVAAVMASQRPNSRSAPRVRYRRPPIGEWATFERKDGGTTVRYQNGLVELANQPDYDFDFRVRFELVDTADGPTLVPSAVAVIARPDQVGRLRPGAFSDAGIARAIKDAAKALTRAYDVPDAPSRRASGSEVEALLPRAPSRHRSTAREVEREAREVAGHLRSLRLEDGRLPWGYAAKVAVLMQWNPEDRASLDRVAKRKILAVRRGLDIGA